VLLSDREAEHIPGCNMAFRKACLEAIGGFDPQYRVAGDDVDVCWRLRQCGWTLGFSPAAMVWHHRRNSIWAYWRQQYGYGKAEALLERKWPGKYNSIGHLSWAGRVYGAALAPLLVRPGRIYHGIWGSAPFQSLYQPATDGLGALPLMPEWYLICGALAMLGALGLLWGPLLLALPVFILAVGVSLAQASLGAARAACAIGARSRAARLKLRALATFLHMLQPLARLRGRLHHGLTPWRRQRARALTLPRTRTFAIWSEHWRAPDDRLRAIEAALRADGARVLRGGDSDRWDLEVLGGMLGAVRILMAVEEHGMGRQLVRFRTSPRCSPAGIVLTLLCAVLATSAALDQAWFASAMLGVIAITLARRMLQERAAATAAVLQALRGDTGRVGAILSALEQSG
jgi:hypothetical protein